MSDHVQETPNPDQDDTPYEALEDPHPRAAVDRLASIAQKIDELLLIFRRLEKSLGYLTKVMELAGTSITEGGAYEDAFGELIYGGGADECEESAEEPM